MFSDFFCTIFSPQIAASLRAEKLVLMTDVPGVLMDKNDISTKIQSLDIRRGRQLIEQGIIAGGMIPKVRRNGILISQTTKTDAETRPVCSDVL